MLNSEGKVFGMFFSMPIQRAEPARHCRGDADGGAGRNTAADSSGLVSGRAHRTRIHLSAIASDGNRQNGETTDPDDGGPSSSSAQTRTGDLARLSSDGRDVPFNDKDSAVASAATTPTRPESTPVARVTEPTSPVGTSGQSPAPAPRAARTRLPSTASNTPGLLFAGLGLIGLAIAVRARRLSRG